MNCEAARARFDAVLDGEASQAERGALSFHRARCAACEAAYENARAARAALRGVLLARAPRGFAEGVLERCAVEARGRRRIRFVPWLVGAAAAAVAVFAIRPSFDSGEGDLPPRVLLAQGPVERWDPPSADWRPLGREEPVPEDALLRGSAGGRLVAGDERIDLRPGALYAVVPEEPRVVEISGPPPQPPVASAEPSPRGPLPVVAPAIAECVREGARFLVSGAETFAAFRLALPRAAPAEATPIPEEPPRGTARAETDFGGYPPTAAPALAATVRLERRGDELRLVSMGPYEDEIPALLAVLRDDGEAARLVRARLASITRDLSSLGIRPPSVAPEPESAFGRVLDLFPPRPEDDRAREVESWRAWWESHQTAIASASGVLQ